MMLRDAQEALAAHVRNNVNALDPVHAAVPRNPVAGSAFVYPADPWLAQDDTEEGTFCDTAQVGLVVDLVAGTADLVQSQAWLADQLEQLWLSAAGGVEVIPHCSIVPITASRPQFTQVEGGAEFLIVTVEFDRFPLEAN